MRRLVCPTSLLLSCVLLLELTPMGVNAAEVDLTSRVRVEPVAGDNGEVHIRPVSDLIDGVELLGTDLYTVFTSPLHGRFWRDERILAVLVTGGVLFVFDEDIEQWSQDIKHEPGWSRLRELGEFFEPIGLMGNTNIYFAGGAVAGYAVGWTRLQLLCGEIFYANLSGGITRDFFQLMLGRRRPNENQGPRAFETWGGTSLPSGHTTTVFSLAEILSHHVQRRWATVVFYSCAGSVGFQRITSRSHWASDVCIAAAMGIGIARIVCHEHEQGRFALGPMFAPGTHQPAVGLRWQF